MPDAVLDADQTPDLPAPQIGPTDAPYYVPGGQATIGNQVIPMPKVRTPEIRDMLLRDAAQRAQAFDDAKKQADQQRYMEELAQNARTQQQVKAVQAVRRYIAMRQFNEAVQAGTQAGLQPEVAHSMALAKFGPQLFDSPEHLMAASVSANRVARLATRPYQEPSVYTAPGGEQFIRMANTLHPVPSGEMKKSQRVSALNSQIKELDSQLKELSNALPGQEISQEVQDIHAQRKALMDEVSGLLGVKEKLDAAKPQLKPLTPEAVAEAKKAVGKDKEKAIKWLKDKGYNIQ